MSKKDEALKLALEALEHVVYWDNGKPEWEYAHKAITALQEALKKDVPEIGFGNMAAQQEPVAYLCENAVGHKYFRWKKPSSTYKPIALYTSPPAQRTWVGLTDEEIDKTHETKVWDARRSYARAIEAKLKEKNT